MSDAERRDAVREAVTGRLTVGALVGSMGGWLGIAEGVLPSLVFLVAFQTTHAVVPAVVASLALSVVFLAWRLVRRQSVAAAVGGALGAGLSAALALFTSEGRNFFVVGLLTNAVYGAAFLVSVLVRRPLIGIAVSFLLGDRDWREEAGLRRIGTWLTLLWVGLFGIRLLVETPLYLAGSTEALGVARLVLGVPLYAPVLVLTVLAVQAAQRGRLKRGGIVNTDGER